MLSLIILNGESMRGYKLTDKQSEMMLMDEIDKALTLPDNFEDIITPFIIKKSVSTIPDECKGVGLEIGTSDVLGNEASENRSGRLRRDPARA